MLLAWMIDGLCHIFLFFYCLSPLSLSLSLSLLLSFFLSLPLIHFLSVFLSFYLFLSLSLSQPTTLSLWCQSVLHCPSSLLACAPAKLKRLSFDKNLDLPHRGTSENSSLSLSCCLSFSFSSVRSYILPLPPSHCRTHTHTAFLSLSPVRGEMCQCLPFGDSAPGSGCLSVVAPAVGSLDPESFALIGEK